MPELNRTIKSRARRDEICVSPTPFRAKPRVNGGALPVGGSEKCPVLSAQCGGPPSPPNHFGPDAQHQQACRGAASGPRLTTAAGGRCRDCSSSIWRMNFMFRSMPREGGPKGSVEFRVVQQHGAQGPP